MLSRGVTALGVAAIVAWTGGTPAAVTAQTELVVDAGVGAFGGGDFAGLRPGPSVGAGIHVSQWSRGHAGLEALISRHEGAPLESPTTQVEAVGFARVTLSPGPIGVYAGGKLGAAWRTLRVVGEPAKTDGFVFGPSVAVRWRIKDTRVQLSVDALYETFEELMMYGGREYGTDEDGLRISIRLGVVLPLAGLRARTQLP